MAKQKKEYVITFGNFNTETKHIFPDRQAARLKQRELKVTNPLIRTKVRRRK